MVRRNVVIGVQFSVANAAKSSLTAARGAKDLEFFRISAFRAELRVVLSVSLLTRIQITKETSTYSRAQQKPVATIHC